MPSRHRDCTGNLSHISRGGRLSPFEQQKKMLLALVTIMSQMGGGAGGRLDQRVVKDALQQKHNDAEWEVVSGEARHSRHVTLIGSQFIALTENGQELARFTAAAAAHNSVKVPTLADRVPTPVAAVVDHPPRNMVEIYQKGFVAHVEEKKKDSVSRSPSPERMEELVNAAYANEERILALMDALTLRDNVYKDLVRQKENVIDATHALRQNDEERVGGLMSEKKKCYALFCKGLGVAKRAPSSSAPRRDGDSNFLCPCCPESNPVVLKADNVDHVKGHLAWDSLSIPDSFFVDALPLKRCPKCRTLWWDSVNKAKWREPCGPSTCVKCEREHKARAGAMGPGPPPVAAVQLFSPSIILKSNDGATSLGTLCLRLFLFHKSHEDLTKYFITLLRDGITLTRFLPGFMCVSTTNNGSRDDMTVPDIGKRKKIAFSKGVIGFVSMDGGQNAKPSVFIGLGDRRPRGGQVGTYAIVGDVKGLRNYSDILDRLGGMSTHVRLHEH